MKTTAGVPKKHAKLSASGAERWMNCPGSVALIELAPPQVESPYALEGTLAHSLLEKILKAHIDGKKPYTVADTLLKTHNPDMVRHALDAYKEIVGLADENDEVFCEQKVPLDFIGPDLFGTLDAAIVSEFGRLTIIDFKYGAGISVEPQENVQLLYYALGMAHRYDYNFSEIALRVIQPRAYHPDSTSREWVTDVGYLKEFAEGLSDAIAETQRKDAPLHSGTWCRFCPAALTCPELSSKAMVQAGLDFAVSEVVENENKLLIPKIENIGETLTAILKLENWFEEVRRYALQVAERGEKINGWKLVQKRSVRKWTDLKAIEGFATSLLGDDAYSEPELRSPAQMEKVMDKKLVAEYVSEVSSGVTLVPDSDRRQNINQLQLDFGDSHENIKTQTRKK